MAKEAHPFAMGSALALAALAVLIVAFSMMATGPAAVLIAAVSSGAFGFWLGRSGCKADTTLQNSFKVFAKFDSFKVFAKFASCFLVPCQFHNGRQRPLIWSLQQRQA